MRLPDEGRREGASSPSAVARQQHLRTSMRDKPLESGFRAPQFSAGLKSAVSGEAGMSAAARELEALFTHSHEQPGSKPPPTVVVRRKRLVATEASARQEAGPPPEADANAHASERQARVFVREAAARVDGPTRRQEPDAPAEVAVGVEDHRRIRRRRPDVRKPSAVVVIRPAPLDGSLEAAPLDGHEVDDGAAVDASSAGFVLDLGINDRWASVDRALSQVKATLSDPPTVIDR
jgi:hypothetical protein